MIVMVDLKRSEDWKEEGGNLRNRKFEDSS
jgi:hypothetical protein